MSKQILQLTNELPVGWTKAQIQDLVIDPKQDIVDGPFGSNLKSDDYVERGIPLIRLQNVERNNFVNKNIQYITKKKSEFLKRHNFIVNDIVVTKLGEPVGKACLVPEYMKQGIVVADIIRIRLTHNYISKKFLMCLLNSPQIQKQFKENTKGTTRPRVNLTKMRNFNLILPSLNEQKRIVSKIESIFSQIDAGLELLDKTKILLKRCRQSVLKSAFEGKIVPQDPDDEPAELLLKRINKDSNKELAFEKENLPRGWSKISFGDYLHLEYGKGLPKNTRNDLGIIPVYGSSGVIGRHDEFLISEPCLIIGRKGSAGEVHYVDEPCYAIDTVYYLKQISLFDLKFLFYLFKNIQSKFVDSSTTIPSLRRDDVHSTEIILPPLNEQKRIISKIESIFGRIDAISDSTILTVRVVLRIKFTIFLILFTIIPYHKFYNTEKNIHYCHSSR